MINLSWWLGKKNKQTQKQHNPGFYLKQKLLRKHFTKWKSNLKLMFITVKKFLLQNQNALWERLKILTTAVFCSLRAIIWDAFICLRQASFAKPSRWNRSYVSWFCIRRIWFRRMFTSSAGADPIRQQSSWLFMIQWLFFKQPQKQWILIVYHTHKYIKKTKLGELTEQKIHTFWEWISWKVHTLNFDYPANSRRIRAKIERQQYYLSTSPWPLTPYTEEIWSKYYLPTANPKKLLQP